MYGCAATYSMYVLMLPMYCVAMYICTHVAMMYVLCKFVCTYVAIYVCMC